MVNIFLNIALFIFKFIGGKLSGSVSVMADAFNNLSDAGTTLAAYFGMKIASVGAGEHHPNGHGRFEWIVALLSSVSVTIIGWELAKNSVEAIINPKVSFFSYFTIVVLVVSIGVKMFMFFYNSNKSKKIDSESYKAIAVDSISDAAATCAVLLSLVFYRATGINIDGWCGIVVSLFIIYNGFQSFSQTTTRILGKNPSEEELDKIKDFVLKNEDFESIYDLQSEDYGCGKHRITMIVVGKSEVMGDKLIIETQRISAEVYKKFGQNIIISLEKSLHDENEVNVRNQIQKIIDNQIAPAKLLNMRISDGGNKKILHIEVGVSHHHFKKLGEVEKGIKSDVKNLGDEYIVIPKVRLMRKHNHNN